MDAFFRLHGLVVPLDRSNVDTDAIIPKQFLKSVKRSGFGPNLFDGWRYLDHGEPGQDHSERPLNHDFVINHERYQDGEVLLTRSNFGCGSSREHAPWALIDHGFRAIIASSYADIFYNNCFNNGLLPIVLGAAAIDTLFDEVHAEPGYRLDINLEAQTVTAPGGEVYGFDIDSQRKHKLLHGLDAIALTLEHADQIRDYEARRRMQAPWLFTDLAEATADTNPVEETP